MFLVLGPGKYMCVGPGDPALPPAGKALAERTAAVATLAAQEAAVRAAEAAVAEQTAALAALQASVAEACGALEAATASAAAKGKEVEEARPGLWEV